MTIVANYWRVVRGFNRDIWLFLLAWALIAFAYFGIMGVLLNLYLLRLGYGPTFIGLLIGSGQLLWAALALPAAAVGSRIGPRNAISSGNATMAIGISLVILVEVLPSDLWSYWLVGTWLLLWTGAALNTVNSIPYLMEISEPAERNYAFAAQSSAIALFAFAGSLTSGFLPAMFAGWLGLPADDAAAYRIVLWMTPFLFVLAALIIGRARSVTLPKPDKSSGQPARRPIRILLFVSLTTFLIAAVEGSVRSFFNVYLDTGLALSTPHIGVIMGIGQLLPAGAALTAPVLMGWLRSGYTFSFTSFAAGLFMVPLAFLTHWGAAALSFVGIIGATSTAGPARNVFGQVCVNPEWRATASASMTIGLGLGWAAVAMLGGFVIDAWGFSTLFAICATLGLVNALLLYVYVRRERYPEAAAASAD